MYYVVISFDINDPLYMQIIRFCNTYEEALSTIHLWRCYGPYDFYYKIVRQKSH